MLVVQLQLSLGIGRMISNPPGDNRMPIRCMFTDAKDMTPQKCSNYPGSSDVGNYCTNYRWWS
jgi:hypothetical protein